MNNNKPVCQLSGADGNAFAILGRVSRALRESGQGHQVAEYMRKATSGDYDNLLRVSLEYVKEED